MRNIKKNVVGLSMGEEPTPELKSAVRKEKKRRKNRDLDREPSQMILDYTHRRGGSEAILKGLSRHGSTKKSSN